MKDQETIQKFVELRSQGWTYTQLMAELSVSKPTLINWSRKFQFQIQNLRAIELEALATKWLSPVTDRVNGLGQQLQKVETELAGREVKDLSTTQLYVLARQLRRQLQEATGAVRFASPVAEIPGDEFHEQVHDWQG
jgi:hypothetical protein